MHLTSRLHAKHKSGLPIWGHTGHWAMDHNRIPEGNYRALLTAFPRNTTFPDLWQLIMGDQNVVQWTYPELNFHTLSLMFAGGACYKDMSFLKKKRKKKEFLEKKQNYCYSAPASSIKLLPLHCISFSATHSKKQLPHWSIDITLCWNLPFGVLFYTWHLSGENLCTWLKRKLSETVMNREMSQFFSECTHT